MGCGHETKYTSMRSIILYILYRYTVDMVKKTVVSHVIFINCFFCFLERTWIIILLPHCYKSRHHLKREHDWHQRGQTHTHTGRENAFSPRNKTSIHPCEWLFNSVIDTHAQTFDFPNKKNLKWSWKSIVKL